MKKQTSSAKKRPAKTIRKVVVHARTRIKEHKASSPHRSFKLTRRSEIPHYAKVLPWWKATASTVMLLANEWRKVGLLLLILVPLMWIISGIYSQDFGDLKESLSILSEEPMGGIEQAVVLFTGFFNVQGTGMSQDSLVLLNFLMLVFWLSFIWIARYYYAKKQTTVREALYTSGTAIVPFLMLVLTLALQLVPGMLAMVIFSSMTGTGFVQGPAEVAAFSVLAVLLIILSLYFITSTFMALNVVALPGMYPWRALRSGRKLVIGRRFSVLRKLIMLAVIVFVFWVIFFSPVLVLDNTICSGGECWSTNTLLPLMYYVLTGISLAFVSTYVYTVYRSLLESEE